MLRGPKRFRTYTNPPPPTTNSSPPRTTTKVGESKDFWTSCRTSKTPGDGESTVLPRKKTNSSSIPAYPRGKALALLRSLPSVSSQGMYPRQNLCPRNRTLSNQGRFAPSSPAVSGNSHPHLFDSNKKAAVLAQTEKTLPLLVTEKKKRKKTMRRPTPRCFTQPKRRGIDDTPSIRRCQDVRKKKQKGAWSPEPYRPFDMDEDPYFGETNGNFSEEEDVGAVATNFHLLSSK